jgi:hypothetical protein
MTRSGAIDWLFRNRATGRITVAQWPNWSIGVFLAATVALRVFEPSGDLRTVLVVIRAGALLIWAVDEIARGVNPWRRLLGAVVLVITVAGLVRS